VVRDGRRSASLRDGWRESFDIQAFIQEELLGGSRPVSSLVVMPSIVDVANKPYNNSTHFISRVIYISAA